MTGSSMKRRFERVGVLMGGPSAEREVSLASGAAVTRGLRSAGYEVTPIDVPGPGMDLPAGMAAAFLALHGTFGEDGTVQQILEDRGIPYTGSGPEASRTAFDKIATKRACQAAALPTPAYEALENSVERTLPLPVVIKPALQGSSIGLHLIREDGEWEEALRDARSYGETVLVESFIEGRELTVGVVGVEVLPVLEIRAPEGHYDFRAKYTQGLTEYLVPAPIPAETAAEAQRNALDAFRTLDCRGMARVDFRMHAAGALYLLEVNTIPGFTETSLLPKAAQAAGIDFPELCHRIMDSASLG